MGHLHADRNQTISHEFSSNKSFTFPLLQFLTFKKEHLYLSEYSVCHSANQHSSVCASYLQPVYPLMEAQTVLGLQNTSEQPIRAGSAAPPGQAELDSAGYPLQAAEGKRESEEKVPPRHTPAHMQPVCVFWSLDVLMTVCFDNLLPLSSLPSSTQKPECEKDSRHTIMSL